MAAGHHTLPASEFREAGPFETVDATDKAALRTLVERHRIDVVYHLASILSGEGEMDPDAAWHVNMVSLKNVLDLAVEHEMAQVFWPSSIAVFGPTTPRRDTPQQTILEPTTMYGVTKWPGRTYLGNVASAKQDELPLRRAASVRDHQAGAPRRACEPSGARHDAMFICR